MIGSFLSRALILALGYAYPAYECYKTVELNKPEIEKLRFWCQYWILAAIMTVVERFADPLISWLPMYGEAKLVFFIYLWYPKTKGTLYIYETFFKPFISKHEKEIDRNLIEVRTRASDLAVMHSHKVLVFVQTMIFEGLRYISVPKSSNLQAQQEINGERSEEKNNIATKKQEKSQVPNKLRTYTKEKKQDGAPSSPVVKKPVVPSSPVVKKQVLPAETESSELDMSSSDELKLNGDDVADTVEKEMQEESVMEETIRVTRARLRKRMGSTGTGTGTGTGTDANE